MIAAIVAHTWRATRVRIVIVAIGLLMWGTVLPVVYDAFGAQFRLLIDSGIVPETFLSLSQLGGGDIFSMSGAVSLGFVHPFALALNLVMAVGFATAVVAGERQRGTLEVLLARPISRRALYLTHASTVGVVIGIHVAALAAGAWLGAAITGNLDELGVANLPLQWLNVVLLFAAFASISLAASVSFDRLAPAAGVSLAVVLVTYAFDVLGTLWPDASGLRAWSPFSYVDGRANLAGLPRWDDMAVLAGIILAGVGYSLVVFPRRDLAAPS
jgi:ABC-2 type transport system permease protein